MVNLRDSGKSDLSKFPCEVTPDFFKSNSLITGTVNSKTFILLLAQQAPLSFVSGQPVALSDVLADYNRSEFHHIYPRSFLRTRGVESDDINSLANFAFISAIDNKVLGAVAPSLYKPRMAQDRLDDISERAFLPIETWNDDYEVFRHQRAMLLTEAAKSLIA
jgi:hypothetical protein